MRTGFVEAGADVRSLLANRGTSWILAGSLCVDRLTCVSDITV